MKSRRVQALQEEICAEIAQDLDRAVAAIDRELSDLTDADLRDLLAWAAASLHRSPMELIGQWVELVWFLGAWIDRRDPTLAAEEWQQTLVEREAARAIDDLIRECGGDPGPDSACGPEV